MGRHSAPEPERSPDLLAVTVPIRRLPSNRAVAGVRFPVVDDLSRIAADDRLLDAIAAGRTPFGVPQRENRSAPFPPHPGAGTRAPTGGSARNSVAGMLAAWRSELADAPMPVLPITGHRAMHGPADRSRRRSLRSMASVAVAISALLLGSTAVGAHSAQPGDPLWALTQVLYTGHADSVVARGAANRSMARAADALLAHDSAGAVRALTLASLELGKVAGNDGVDQLRNNWRKLWNQAHGHPTPSKGSPDAALTADALAAGAGVSGVAQTSSPADGSSGAASANAASSARTLAVGTAVPSFPSGIIGALPTADQVGSASGGPTRGAAVVPRGATGFTQPPGTAVGPAATSGLAVAGPTDSSTSTRPAIGPSLPLASVPNTSAARSTPAPIPPTPQTTPPTAPGTAPGSPFTPTPTIPSVPTTPVVPTTAAPATPPPDGVPTEPILAPSVSAAGGTAPPGTSAKPAIPTSVDPLTSELTPGNTSGSAVPPIELSTTSALPMPGAGSAAVPEQQRP